jgi:hypothetical protein
VPFLVKVKDKVNIKIEVKSGRTNASVPTRVDMADGKPRSLALLGMTDFIFNLREFEAVGLGEEGPGFAVGVVDVGLAAAFGA